MKYKMIKTMLIFSIAVTAFMPMTLSAKEKEQQNEKEENVYVVSDADGKVEDVVVSGWLKNNEKVDKLKDLCNLKDVVNVKGKQKLTTADGINTWDAKGKDIYYQGSASTEVPVNVKITYTLDDKEMKAKDMLGKSGKISIHVAYENNAKVMREGKEYYVSMLMASAMILDTDKFTNVTIDNGKIINDGSRYLVVGVGISGFNENLGLSEEIIPSSFTISADAKDFATSEMLTYASNEMLNDLDLSNVSSIDALLEAMNQLSSSSSQLADGSTALADGIAQLASKSVLLINGANQLDEGAGSLSNGLSDLKNGLANAYSGSEQLSVGLQKVSQGIDQLMAARVKVATGLDQIATGMDSATAALARSITYNEQVDQYLTGLQTSMDAIMNDAQKQELKNVIAANKGSIAYQENVKNTLSAIAQEGTLRNALAQLQAVMAENNDQSFGAGLAAIKNAICATMKENGQSGLIEGMNVLQTGISKAYEGSEKLSLGAVSLKEGTNALKQSGNTLMNGTDELNTGAQTLKAGMQLFHETGIQKLVQVFNNDIKQLIGNVNETLEAGKAYQSFSGLSDDMKGSVKFIIKTAAVE